MNRRTFLSSLGGTVVAVASRGASADSRAAGTAVHATNVDPKPYRVIDTHLHLFNTKLQGKDGIPNYIAADATVEAALAAMDRGGVEKAFLISYNAEDVAVQIRQRGVSPVDVTAVMNRAYQVAAWQAHKDRFWWFPDSINPLREGYLDDLLGDFERGATGIKLLPWFKGLLPDHPGFVEVYELCQKHSKPVILDLSWWYFHLYPLFNETPTRQKLVQSFADYARLLDPLFRQFARVAFSLAHCGAVKNSAEYEDLFALMNRHPNVSCDVAAATDYSPAFVERLVKGIGAHKVMYGTDWPYWSSGPDSYRTGSRRWSMITEDCPSLDEQAQRLILAENAERFARNELPADETGERARALHQKSIVIVMHDHRPIAADVPLMLAGGVTAKVYQIGVDVEIGADFRTSPPPRGGWGERARAAIEDARRVIAADSDHVLLARSAADIRRAKREGKVAILLGVEGGKLLEGQLDQLAQFYELGLRELQLRWAVPNELVERDSLTDFGRAVVRESNRLGIIVDLTHIPERAFHDVIELAEKPPIVSHGTGGNDLNDRRIMAIARHGGVIGIHFYSSYLGPRPTIERALDAIDYVARRAGIETVGLGVDFFPSHGKWRDFQLAQGTQDISWAIPDLSHMQQVTRGLLARGYCDDAIASILGGNVLRVCQQVFGG